MNEYKRLKQKKYRFCNEFFTCPLCLQDCFRVYLKAYLSDDVEGTPDTDFFFCWNKESVVFLSLNCKCLHCGFGFKMEKVLPADSAIDNIDDPYDFVVDYFQELKKKLLLRCLEAK